MIKRAPAFFCLITILVFFSHKLPAQNGALTFGVNSYYKTGLEDGINLYSEGRWEDAIAEFLRAQKNVSSKQHKAEAQFWIGVSKLSAGLFREAIYDLDGIAAIDSESPRIKEALYHKGRALYYLERYTEAIQLFSTYAGNIHIDRNFIDRMRVSTAGIDDYNNAVDSDYNKKASAIFWLSECYYLLGDLDRAEKGFMEILTDYKKSRKFEISENRLALVRQKRIENELRNMVAAKRENAQDDAITAYQERVTPYIIDKAKEEDVPPPVEPVTPPVTDQKNTDQSAIMRLLAIKKTALSIMDPLAMIINSYEVIDLQRWKE
ncbi:hypothetical protein AGMMS50212_14860 [Spirochaetia bacterium]|nr:hypothetical protein AGMMS50212_14860 [Spirochaetia bacterium]